MKDVNIKVAMLGHKVVPSRRGGIENVLTSLCPLLVRLGAEVTCYNRSSDAVENEYIGTVTNKQFRGVRLKTAPTLKIRGIAAMLASYTAAVRAAFGQYDIVHFHAEGPCAAMWIPKLFGKTCIATVGWTGSAKNGARALPRATFVWAKKRWLPARMRLSSSAKAPMIILTQPITARL